MKILRIEVRHQFEYCVVARIIITHDAQQLVVEYERLFQYLKKFFAKYEHSLSYEDFKCIMNETDYYYFDSCSTYCLRTHIEDDNYDTIDEIITPAEIDFVI